MNEVMRFFVLRPPSAVDDSNTIPLSIEADQFQAELAVARQSTTPVVSVSAAAATFLKSGKAVKNPASLRVTPKLTELGDRLATSKEPIDVAALVKDVFGESANRIVARTNFQQDKARLYNTVIAAAAVRGAQQVPVRKILQLIRAADLITRVANGETVVSRAQLKMALIRSAVLPSTVFPLTTPPANYSAPLGATTPSLAADSPEQKHVVLKSELDALNIAAVYIASLVKAGQNTGRAGATYLNKAVKRPVQPTSQNTMRSAPASVKQTLRSLGIDPSKASLEGASNAVQARRGVVAGQLAGLAEAAMPQRVVQLGDIWKILKNTASAAPPGISELAPPNLPTTHGTLQSVGIADLKTVQQTILRYEAGEVSHIENVLKSETRKHVTKQIQKTDQFTLTDQTTTTTEIRDLQTTERFELQQESDEVIKQDSQLKAGVSLSAKYGGMLEINTSVNAQLSSSKQDSTKQASSYGKDVTSRAASNVTTRVQQEQTQRVTQKFAELDTHSFENDQANAGNIVGIYQWVDKVYQAQVFNYGQRVMFDVMVPEPAAFYIDMVEAPQSPSDQLIKPAPFTLLPEQLAESATALATDASGAILTGADGTPIQAFYQVYAAAYGASGVKPPPVEAIYISKSYTFKIQDDSGHPQVVTPIAIPITDGYVTQTASVRGTYNDIDPKKAQQVDIFIGAQHFLIDQWNATVWQAYLPIEACEKEVGIAISTHGINDFALTIEIQCQRTQTSFEQWQIDTHTAITTAYTTMLSDYQTALEKQEFQERNTPDLGQNPDENRIIEQAELKKACITLLTQQHFGWLDAIEQPGTAPQSYPQTNLSVAEVQGSYIRFFEQAFEWEHMTYFFYPYYWGRKSNWYDRAQLSDSDPLFEEFLKAGAARVVFPVRPGFENAIAHYLDNRELWDSSDFVDVSSPLYLPITEEIKDATDANAGSPVAEGDPWEVRLPTTLVVLRTDDTLPAWVQVPNQTGTGTAWVPAKWNATSKSWVPE